MSRIPLRAPYAFRRFTQNLCSAGTLFSDRPDVKAFGAERKPTPLASQIKARVDRAIDSPRFLVCNIL